MTLTGIWLIVYVIGYFLTLWLLWPKYEKGEKDLPIIASFFWPFLLFILIFM